MNTTWRLYVICSVLAFGLGFGTWLLKAQTQTLRVVPYSTVERLTVENKHVALLRTSVSSTGSLATETGDRLVILDVAQKLEIIGDRMTQAYVRAPLSARRIAGLTAKLSDCVTFFKGTRERVTVQCEPGGSAFGHPLVKVTITKTLSDGSSGTEVLHVIEKLGWLIARKEQYDSAGRLGMKMEVIELKEGEPAASDFSVPFGYREMPNFLELARVEQSARGKTLTPEQEKMHMQKWENVTKEARAEGDRRF